MGFGGSRHNVLDDEDAGTRLRATTDVPQDLPAFAVTPVVEDHLQAIDIGFRRYFFKHVGRHILATRFQTKCWCPELIRFGYYFRQIKDGARQVGMSGEKGTHHVAVTSANVAPGRNRSQTLPAQRLPPPCPLHPRNTPPCLPHTP